MLSGYGGLRCTCIEDIVQYASMFDAVIELANSTLYSTEIQ